MNRRTLRRLARLRSWLRDRSLTALVILLVLGIFVLPPLADLGMISRPLIGVTIAVVMAAGILTAARSRIAAIVTLALGLLLLPLQWVRYDGPTLAEETAFLGTAMLFVASLGVTIFRQVFAAGRINLHRILGAIALYLLIGVFFSLCYQMLLAYVPGAIAYAAQPEERIPVAAHMNYFSFVTLTSVGYGDVTPKHAIARSLANFEAVVGQLYVAVLLARLVSLGLRKD
jgi:hypothetical protein